MIEQRSLRDAVYAAFLSYSHRGDTHLASALQRAIERLGNPWWRRSRVRVFRDDSSLPASAALWPAIEAGLQKSRHFVLLASTAAARSAWIDQEVRWWLAHRGHESLVLVVSGGEVEYDAAASDFDWLRTNCLPASLRGVFHSEPRWIDLRFARPEHFTLRHPAFRTAAMAVAAAVRGMAPDELESEELRRHRQAVAVAAAAVGVIGGLSLATLVAVGVARSQSATARDNRLEAESRRLAAEALVELGDGRRIEAATIKAAIAWRLSPTDAARRALQRIDETTPDVARVLGAHTGQLDALTFSPDGTALITAGSESVVLRWSLQNGRRIGGPLVTERQHVEQLRFSRDGSHLLVRGRSGDPEGAPVLSVFRMADGMRLPIGVRWLEMLRDLVSRSWDPWRTTPAAISPGGRRVAIGSSQGLVTIDTMSGVPSAHRLPSGLSLEAVSFGEEAQLLIVVSENVTTVGAGRLDLGTGTLAFGPRVAIAGIGFTALSDDGRRLALQGGLGGLSLWHTGDDLRLRRLPTPDPRPVWNELTGHWAPEFDAQGRRVGYGVNGTAYVWEPDTQRMVKTIPFGGGHGVRMSLSADGRRLAALDRGTPTVWELDENTNGRRLEARACGGARQDECIQQLCERITVQRNEEQWRTLLGSDYAALVESLEGTACAAP